MERTFKTLLLWLLMALVPLHAGAAAMGMSCGPVHQLTMSSVAEHQDVVAHQHDDGSASAGLAEALSPSDSTDASEDLAHSTCSACSGFCIGAVAPPSSFSSLPALNGAESVVASLSLSVIGFVPDGLKRPPRAISA